ncbi:MAG TPA: SCO family protein [Woeseiaceae bacterium]|nr:SCO family protein [Woeseiaceae bacterium]
MGRRTALMLFLAAGILNPGAAGADPAHAHAAEHDHSGRPHAAHDHAGHHDMATMDDGADEERPARGGGVRWGADYFPNVPLVTQDGETVHFFDDLIKGKVVTINLLYTNCPNMCSLVTARLARVQKLLGERVGKDIFMYSITIDPEHDTPEKLRAHMEKFNVGPGWTFLTGKPEDIMLLRMKLGFLSDGVQVELNDHSGAVLIGNQRTGQWMKRMATSSPHILAAQIGSWLSNWRTPNPQLAGYAGAPKLQAPSMGETLFRTRCAACHAIGNLTRTVAGDGTVDAGELLGPDLLGVSERRSREWLVRWLKNPKQMLQDEDPVALALYAAYGEVTMPNFRLSDIEVEALLEFMREESKRVRSGALASRQPGPDPQVKTSRNDDIVENAVVRIAK